MRKEFYKEYFLFEKDYWFFTSRRKIILSVLDMMLEHKQGLKILDVGTGTGVMTETLKRYGQVTGVDKSEEAIRYCRARGISDIMHASAEKMPFENGRFELVCAMDILEHVENDVGVLMEFYRILKPGGLLVVTVPAYGFLWTFHDEINMHKRRYDAHALRTAMESGGFEVRKFSYFNSLLFPFIATAKILRKLPVGNSRSRTKSDLVPVPRIVNRILEVVFSSESVFLKYMNFPFGVSLMCVAYKPLK